jgi:glycosyltransferase involved in cell wall biosynthesis
MNKLKSVRFVPLQPHCLAFGGFELQMINAMKAVQAFGVDVKPLDFWAKNESFNILHLWGLSNQHSQTAYWAKQAGKKIVLSALANYLGVNTRLRSLASLFFGMARYNKKLLSNIDAVTVVNEDQKRYLVKVYGLEKDLIHVVPNIVEDIFYSIRSQHFESRMNIKDYIICTGNVCRRKNQLALAHACRILNVPLLIVGDIISSEQSYGNNLSKLVENYPNLYWIKGIEAGSMDLALLYKHASAFALPSFNEQQPISALEAAAVGKPLLLADRQYAKQKLYLNAKLTQPESINSIINSLDDVLNDPNRYCVPIEIIKKCRSQEIGKEYNKIYNDI